MNILVLSDIHGNFDAFRPHDLPDADRALFAGDLTERGLHDSPDVLSQAERWLRAMAFKYPRVLAIPGNHDIGFQRNTFPEINGLEWIQDETVSLGVGVTGINITVHGVNLSPSYLMPELVSKLDFMTTDYEAEAIAYNFEPVSIVLSHAPPFGILDTEGKDPHTNEAAHIGSQALLQYIKLAHPQAVVCGHVHAAQGVALVEFDSHVTRVYNTAKTHYLLTI